MNAYLNQNGNAKLDCMSILFILFFCNIYINIDRHRNKGFILNVQNSIQNHNIFWNVDCKSFILGYHKPSQGHFNILCLEIKRYIFLCKRKEVHPTLQGLKNSLKLASLIITETESKISMYSLVNEIVNL